MPAPVVFPPDCEAVVRALWDYLDGALDEPDMAVIDAHLADCEYCRAHAAFERELIGQIRALRREHDDAAELRSRVLDALRRAAGDARQRGGE
ncbi:MAG TPA: zf-HC2 domain-containing protein [Gemmatimonadaceae bacterium]|nr:zf-HC2 domain-containing protein [Gemmatimonadaceae bacterium]